MDGCMWSMSSNHQRSLHPAGRGTAVEIMPRITWRSARPEYWPSASGEAFPQGIACLLFEVGRAGWLVRLGRSKWFEGLQSQAENSALSGIGTCATWTMPAGAARHDDGLAAEIDAFFASVPLPSAWLAAVAAPCGAGPVEAAMTLGLVRALRGRRDPLGRYLDVVVTIDAALASPRDTVIVHQLRERGAFVIRGAGKATGDHLHHFPLRAVVRPREGRLICVDLADYLYTWRAGRVGDLHVLPFDLDAAARDPSEMPLLAGTVRALNLLFHLDRRAATPSLAEIDRYVVQCREQLLPPAGDVVFTTADRLDGKTGSVDLLVIRN